MLPVESVQNVYAAIYPYLSQFHLEMHGGSKVHMQTKTIILKLKGWKEPYGTWSPDPVKEAEWGTKHPIPGHTDT